MKAIDRTNEFQTIVENLRRKKQPAPPRPPRTARNKSQFSLIAAQIGKQIADTSEKLEKLSKLARKKTLFDDPSFEIQELTSIINENIKNLNGQLAALQQQKGEYSNRSKHQTQHSDSVLHTLNNKLKLTTKDFSQVLELRTQAIKTQQKEREHFTGTLSPAFGRRAAESPLYKTTAVPENDNGGEVAITIPQSALLTQERFVASRADAVASIERTMGELQNIFQQLAHLVAEQGELIERIDSNVDDALHNVNDAQGQLLIYLKNVSSNRWLMAKVFFVLILFAALFIIFFV